MGSSLLCNWKGLHEQACLCHLPVSQAPHSGHFTLIPSMYIFFLVFRALHGCSWCPGLFFSLYLAFSLSSKKENVLREPTHSPAQLKGPLSQKSPPWSPLAPQCLVGAPHTPHLTLPTLWYNFGVHFLRPPGTRSAHLCTAATPATEKAAHSRCSINVEWMKA